jgi:hypothetical protein
MPTWWSGGSWRQLSGSKSSRSLAGSCQIEPTAPFESSSWGRTALSIDSALLSSRSPQSFGGHECFRTSLDSGPPNKALKLTGRPVAQAKGEALVELPTGHLVQAELHWYEAHGVGRFGMKIKRLLG